MSNSKPAEGAQAVLMKLASNELLAILVVTTTEPGECYYHITIEDCFFKLWLDTRLYNAVFKFHCIRIFKLFKVQRFLIRLIPVV